MRRSRALMIDVPIEYSVYGEPDCVLGAALRELRV